MELKLIDAGEYAQGTALLCEEYGFALTETGLPVRVRRREEGLTVRWSPKGAEIGVSRPVSFFRGFGLLIEALREGRTAGQIAETPHFDTCGAMLDLSHGALMTVDAIEAVLRRMAVMGLDMLMLYSEEGFEVPEYPYFGHLRGRYTQAEIRRIDDYAAIFGIEIIPAIQTLGHLNNTLRWPCFAGIADTGDCLLVGEEKTYTFIEALLRAASAPVRSRRIHIGFDETMSLGTGKYMALHGHRPRIDIFCEHLQRVAAMCEKMGLEPMIWSDMFFRLKGSAHGYAYDNAEIPEDVMRRIPAGIGLVDASYSRTDPAAYEASLAAHLRTGREVWFAGAVQDWHGFCVNYRLTFPASRAALTAARRQGVRQVFATTWGDDSTERDVFCDLLGFQLYAEFCWRDAPDDAWTDRRYGFCAVSDAGMIRAVSAIDIPDAAHLPEADNGLLERFDDTAGLVNPSKYLMWQDPLLGKFDYELTKYDYAAHFRDRGTALRAYCGRCPGWEESLDFYIALCDALAEKCTLGTDIRAAYRAGDRAALERIVRERIPRTAALVRTLWEKNRTLWYARYRTYGWEVLERRYGALLMRLDTAARRLEAFLRGGAAPEELDEPVLPYSEASRDQVLYYNDYLHTSTAWGR